jgi:hypothetical protein
MVEVVGGRMSGLHISVRALCRVVHRAVRMVRRSGGVGQVARGDRCGAVWGGPREVCPVGFGVGVCASELVLLCVGIGVNGLAYSRICSWLAP